MPRKVVRSTLFTPADNPDRMRNAAETEADACNFDLEDAVPEHKQETARENLRQIVDEVDFGDKVIKTRIKATDSEYWLGDLQAAVNAGVDEVTIPKVETSRDIHLVTETAKQLTDDPPTFGISLESPEGVFSGTEIARYCADVPLVTRIGAGSADYHREIGAPEISDRTKEWMSHLIAGIAAIGDLEWGAPVTLEVDNLDRLRRNLELGRELGATGASCIHPKQIPVVNDVFTPSEERYTRAKRLVEAYDRSEGDSIRVDGTFLDAATADRYRDIVARYKQFRGE